MKIFSFAVAALSLGKAACQSLVDVVSSDAELGTLVTALVAGSFIDALQNDNFTVFAPTDQALSTLDLKYLNESWSAHLAHFLRFHLVQGAPVLSTDLVNGMEITTEARNELPIVVSVIDSQDNSSQVFLSGRAFNLSQVVEADLVATNGVVHKVDQFFLPISFALNLLQVAQNAPGFSKVLELLATSGLESAVTAPDRTIFAPSDFAFDSLDEDVLVQINADPEMLGELLQNHVVDGVYPDALLVEGSEVTVLSGRTFVVGRSGFGFFSKKTVGGVSFSVVDVVASNGIAHSMDGILLEGVLPETLSDVPSDVPSSVPSAVIVFSDVPSDIPSTMPSDMPSSVFVDAGSDMPSSVPVDAGSDMPSSVPTDVPEATQQPSKSPVELSTTVPSWGSPPPVPTVNDNTFRPSIESPSAVAPTCWVFGNILLSILMVAVPFV